MSGMPTLHGLSLITPEGEKKISKQLKDTVKEQKEELEGLGLKITEVHLSGDSVPPRFFIQFPEGEQMVKYRFELENSGWDVGQQMGEKMLHFYASKRSFSGGWS